MRTWDNARNGPGDVLFLKGIIGDSCTTTAHSESRICPPRVVLVLLSTRGGLPDLDPISSCVSPHLTHTVGSAGGFGAHDDIQRQWVSTPVFAKYTCCR